MAKKHRLIVLLAIALALGQTALAQSKAAPAKSAPGKPADDFQKQALALSTTAETLGAMRTKASPHDKELLGIINGQLGVIGAHVDGVAALSQLVAQMRDPRDLELSRKYLAAHCESLRGFVGPAVTYVKGVAAGVAAVAITAEVGKATELAGAMGQHPVCTDKRFNPLSRGG